MNQSELNTFIRTYFNPYKKRYPNQIIFDPNTSKEHNQLIVDICMWARDRGLTFFTRVYLKGGEIVDILIPELPNPLIEVRHSELKKHKEYLSEYDGLRKYIDTTDPFGLL